MMLTDRILGAPGLFGFLDEEGTAGGTIASQVKPTAALGFCMRTDQTFFLRVQVYWSAPSVN